MKAAFYRLLSIPERAAQNMVADELRARAAREQSTEDYGRNEEPESCES